MEAISKARLKWLRSLLGGKGRKEHKAFVAEGLRLLTDAIRAGHQPMLLAIAQEHAQRDQVRQLASHVACPVYLVHDKDFAAISDTEHSQGLLAAFASPEHSPRRAFAQTTCTLLVVDNLRDPGNMGMLFRHAAAFDCGGIFLTKGCCDPCNPKAVRASMGGIFAVPFETDCEANTLLADFAAHAVKCYALEAGADAQPAFGTSYAERSCFILGGETEGVGESFFRSDLCRIAIPQSDRIDSLNAAVAASIMLCHRYAASRS